MTTFSRRYKYNVRDIQLECASNVLKRRIVAAFYKQEFDTYDTIDWTNYTTGIEDMMIQMGVPYEFPKNEIYKKKNAEALQSYILDEKQPWYIIFDFIERYSHIFESYDSDTAYLTEEQLQKNFASSLSYERDGYTAKNPEFQQYLQGLRPRHFRLEEEYVRSYSLSLPTLWKLYCNERDLIREVAVKAIVEYAKSKGYKVSKQYNSYKDEHNVPMSEYYITIYFRC